MIPVKIQNAQMGALSADKAFQSQKNIPQNAQKLFEAEVKKQMEEAEERTKEAEKSEKSHIRDEKKENDNKQGSKKRQAKQKASPAKNTAMLIEKNEDGTINHIDVKI